MTEEQARQMRAKAEKAKQAAAKVQEEARKKRFAGLREQLQKKRCHS